MKSGLGRRRGGGVRGCGRQLMRVTRPVHAQGPARENHQIPQLAANHKIENRCAYDGCHRTLSKKRSVCGACLTRFYCVRLVGSVCLC
jgi:hypothetical protein